MITGSNGSPNLDDNVILCGFMGCGKTTVGQALASRIGAGFVDLDDFIEKRENMTIPDIFAIYGEESFREREHSAILEISHRKGVVIATGGGALTYPRNVSALKGSGSVVFLNTGFDECHNRVKDTDRPLVLSNTREQLEVIYNRRAGQYRDAADFELAATGTPDEIADKIVSLLGL